MADVSKFVLDSQEISVKDDTARTTANSASALATSLNTEVQAIKQMTRLTVTYNSSTETMTFTTGAHNTGN